MRKHQPLRTQQEEEHYTLPTPSSQPNEPMQIWVLVWGKWRENPGVSDWNDHKANQYSKYLAHFTALGCENFDNLQSYSRTNIWRRF